MSKTITSTHDADVSQIIKVLLVDRQLRHSDLAAELDFDAGTMSRALNGRRKWTVEEIKHISDYLDVRVEVLLGDPRDLIKKYTILGSSPPDPMQQTLFALAA
jgi:DNA-binding Xre family transcriptional regulator